VWITVCAQVCSGMLHMERHGLIHRDLAARNVLVFNFDKSLPTLVRVKIADYGK
jgi:serine/threonine protein kinase